MTATFSVSLFLCEPSVEGGHNAELAPMPPREPGLEGGPQCLGLIRGVITPYSRRGVAGGRHPPRSVDQGVGTPSAPPRRAVARRAEAMTRSAMSKSTLKLTDEESASIWKKHYGVYRAHHVVVLLDPTKVRS